MGAQVVLVFYHWGNEYERHSNVLQKYIAWKTAHMGADAIIGSHSHVMQELGCIEVANKKDSKRVPVFYGLGNYIWGVAPMPGRETVNHGMIAKLNITVAEDGTVSAKPSYVPLEIAQAANEFTVLDLSANEAPKTWFEREQKYKFSYFRALYEIEQTVENQVHNVSTEMCFDSLFRVNTGAMASLLNFLPEKKFVRFFSEDAIIASVLQNGVVIGNRGGYTGITATAEDGTEYVCMVCVSGKDVSEIPIIINANNSIRDIYAPKNRVTGQEYALPQGIALCEAAAKAWKRMYLAARADGVYLEICSGFRTKKNQLLKINAYAEKFGRERAQQRFTPFGCSEHHLGFALDAKQGAYKEKATSKETAFLWLRKNCYKFGFVARASKASLANQAYVHMRYYPDAEFARYLTEKNVTLEQFYTDYAVHKEGFEQATAWRSKTAHGRLSSRTLTLRRICEIVGIPVPSEFKSIQDRVVPQITLSDTVKVFKGSIFFYDKMLAKELKRCRNALRSGAVLAFAEEQIYDELGEPMPTIVVDDSLTACVKVGKYIRDCYKAKTVCITGSAGKTTTTEMVYQVLSSRYNTHTCTTLNNANNRVNILRLIQQLKPEHEMYVQECGGSFPDHIARGAEMLQPDVAIITNIGEAHLDLYKTFDNIKKDKLSLFENRRPGGIGIMNIDNRWLRERYEQSSEDILAISIEDSSADYYGCDIVQEPESLQMTVVEADGTRTPVKVHIVGRHNAYNILAAFAVGRWAHMTTDEIVAGIMKYHPLATRQNTRNVGGYSLYVDCFSSVELSLVSSVETLCNMHVPAGSKKIAVIWELMRLGEDNERIHARVAEKIRDLKLDHILVFGEKAKALADGLAGGPAEVFYTTNWFELTDHIWQISKPGDVLLFKGQHMQSTSLAIDAVFGTEFVVNNANERRDNGVVFNNGAFSGVNMHHAAAVIDEYIAEDKQVNIPDTIKGCRVICLNKEACAGKDITGVAAGAFLASILDDCFAGCKHLKEVDAGNVRCIGYNAFKGCEELESVTLGTSCLEIAPTAFSGCTKLTIYGPAGSYVEKYAAEHGIRFECVQEASC